MSVETLPGGVLGRIGEVRQGPDGLIYLTNENLEGDSLSKIFRLEPVLETFSPEANWFPSADKIK